MSEENLELIKAIAQGDFKAIPEVVLTKWIDSKRFEKIFIDAGASVANYERTGSEESETRRILFGEDNMRKLAAHMRRIDDFSWWNELQKCIHNLLENADISISNQQACERHFCEIIEHKVKYTIPKICERSILQELQDNLTHMEQRMDTAMERMCFQDELLREFLRKMEEERQHVRQEHSENAGVDEVFTEEKQCTVSEWHINHIHVEGIWKPKEERATEIRTLIEEWGKERQKFPGWYILPKKYCRELVYNSHEYGLLQSHQWLDVQTMLEFAFELVWRWEKCFHLYSKYDYVHICTIWDHYAEKLSVQQWEDADEDLKADIRKWFYIGQVLLRIFREYGEDAEWTRVFNLLRTYEKYGINGKTDLQLERAKLEFHHMNLPGLRRELSRCQPKKEQYEQRLQILGLRIECGEVKVVIPELQLLIQEIKEAVSAAELENYKVSCLTLQVCALQLLSLCVQGVHDFEEDYELHQGEINRLLDEIDMKKALFDWDEWKDNLERELLRWKVKKSDTKEAFELERETITLFGGENYCEEAYRFYRVLDRLALPLKCGYVTLLGNLEQPWMEAILELDSTLGLFLVVQSNRSDTLKTLVNRDYVTGLETGEIEKMLGHLLCAMDDNVDELHSLERYMAGSIVSHMSDNAPELLMRLMSRCPENFMKKALLLLKKLMEDEELPIDYPMSKLLIAIMKQVSEKQKARMLGTMMDTAICEHRMLHGHADGIDLFDYYFCKTDIGENRRFCQVEDSTVEWLLEPSEKADYAWRTKVTRLEVLDDLGLLTDQQQKAYAQLLWSHVSEETGLPMLTNYHLWAFEKLPCVNPSIPVLSVKGYFLNQNLRDQFEDENGWKITMGEISYLDELIVLCQNVEPDYWKPEEVARILDTILDYWSILQSKVCGNSLYFDIWSEYRGRAQKMIQGVAAVCGNLSGAIETEQIEKLRIMSEEMRKIGHGVSTKEVDLILGLDPDILTEIQEEICSADAGLVAGALRAAFQYIRKNPEGTEAQEMLDAIFETLHYRKMPGLTSALWVLHNLVYEECPIMKAQNCVALDHYLLEIAGVIAPDKEMCKLRMKDILSIRKACAALAYELYHRNILSDGPGVLEWKRIISGEEVNEVKNQWVSQGDNFPGNTKKSAVVAC